MRRSLFEIYAEIGENVHKALELQTEHIRKLNNYSSGFYFDLNEEDNNFVL